MPLSQLPCFKWSMDSSIAGRLDIALVSFVADRRRLTRVAPHAATIQYHPVSIFYPRRPRSTTVNLTGFVLCSCAIRVRRECFGIMLILVMARHTGDNIAVTNQSARLASAVLNKLEFYKPMSAKTRLLLFLNSQSINVHVIAVCVVN